MQNATIEQTYRYSVNYHHKHKVETKKYMLNKTSSLTGFKVIEYILWFLFLPEETGEIFRA